MIRTPAAQIPTMCQIRKGPTTSDSMVNGGGGVSTGLGKSLDLVVASCYERKIDKSNFVIVFKSIYTTYTQLMVDFMLVRKWYMEYVMSFGFLELCCELSIRCRLRLPSKLFRN